MPAPGPVPTPAPVPGFPPVPTSAPTGVPRGRRLRLVLAVLGGVLALLCMGGVGIAFVLYDDATKIDRASPDVVVDNYLRAFLVNRNDDEAALYRCASPTNLTGLTELRSELVDREKKFNVRVTVSWSSLTVTEIDVTHKSVKADLVIAGSSDGQVRSRRTEQWAFDVVDQDGWRVCGAAKVS
jgi:hypothetical protein